MDNPIPTSTIPKPKGHFLLGNIPEIHHDRAQFLVDVQRKYGDVVSVHFGPAEIVMIFHPDGVQRVMQDNHKNYSKETRTFDYLSLLLGNGLLTSNGDFWLRQRRLMQPAFHHKQINALSEMIVGQTQAILEHLEPLAEARKTVDLSHEIMNLTLGIATQALFGSRVQDVDGDLAEMIAFLISDTPFRMEHPFYPPLWFPTPHNQRFNTALQRFDRLINGIIAERRKHMGEQNNLLDLLMQAHLEGDESPDASTGAGPQRMTDKQLRDEVVTLFLAGHETTAVNLCWTLYLLAQHPEVEIKLRRELDQVLRGRPPALEDLPQLEYTRQVRDEALRLYPPAWVTERKTLREDVLCGYPILPGTRLGISQFATHRHPGFWENPDTFDPERFSPEHSAGRHSYAYFPFGGGPRQCIGKNLALLEIQLALPMLLQRFRFELEPGRQVKTDPEITLRPRGGLQMRLKAV
jgi:cytochrome P450